MVKKLGGTCLVHEFTVNAIFINLVLCDTRICLIILGGILIRREEDHGYVWMEYPIRILGDVLYEIYPKRWIQKLKLLSNTKIVYLFPPSPCFDNGSCSTVYLLNLV